MGCLWDNVRGFYSYYHPLTVVTALGVGAARVLVTTEANFTKIRSHIYLGQQIYCLNFLVKRSKVKVTACRGIAVNGSTSSLFCELWQLRSLAACRRCRMIAIWMLSVRWMCLRRSDPVPRSPPIVTWRREVSDWGRWCAVRRQRLHAPSAPSTPAWVV